MDNRLITCSCLICEKRFETEDRLQTWCSEECKSKLIKNYCKKCDVEFYQKSKLTYCSDKCRTRLCDQCNIPYIQQNSKQKFCSQKCREKFHTYKCKACGEDFVSKTYTKKTFCSKECQTAYSKAVKINRICKGCKKVIKTGNYSLVYCSDECKNEHLNRPDKKEKDHLLEIVTNRVETLLKRREDFLKESYTYTINYNNQVGFTDSLKEQVIERDGKSCYVCEVNSFLDVHHILPRKLGGKNELDNLVTLCRKCHRHIETGNREHAIKKCFENAKRNFGIRDYTLRQQLTKLEIANILENELNRIYSRITENKDDLEEALVDFDNIFDYIDKLK